MTMTTKAELLACLKGSGQEHVLTDYDSLTPDEQRELAHQITHCAHDFQHLNAVLKVSLDVLYHPDALTTSVVRPPPHELVWDVNASLGDDVASHQSSAMWKAGLDVIAQGKAAVLMLAGGSGTRLGVSIPKGLFICELLPQQKSLFQIDCEKILRTEALAAEAAAAAAMSRAQGEPPRTVRIPLLIMTSEENDAATKRFFDENANFGLAPEQVMFFKQSSLPCYDESSGKILMASRGKMCVAPGGNGGVYQALAHTKQPSGRTTLEELMARGVELVQIFSVDNILARIADPLFFGYTHCEKAHVVVKTVAKVGWEERVGVFAQLVDTGGWVVLEYTEIGGIRAAMKDPVTGTLAYNCGNIVSHCCSVPFLAYTAEKMRSSVHYHAARKTIETVEGPRSGVKLEAFIFDMFQFCNDPALQAKDNNGDDSAVVDDGTRRDRFRIMQISRAEEFAPIKNADTAATDNAKTAAQLVRKLHTKWTVDALQQHLKDAHDQADGAAAESPVLCREALKLLTAADIQVEVSPLVSLQGEGLEAYVPAIAAQVVRTHLAVLKNADSAPQGPARSVVSVTPDMAPVSDESALVEHLAHV